MTNQKILITGGCGFIGTQVTMSLIDSGHDITVVDKSPPVYRAPVRYVQSDYAEFFEINTEKYDTVIHLAAEHLVEHSVANPAVYYANNVVKMQVMLDSMVRTGTKNIIFSSSGNIYGRQGLNGPLQEKGSYYDPVNPYASTKVAGELLIKDYANAYGLNYVTFRYFNAAGADPEGRFGYIQNPATHVIPILCNKILTGDLFSIYGSNYPTMDGTCVRDYVHVADIASAHVLALNLLSQYSVNETFNIGGSRGSSGGISVLDLVKIAEDVVGIDSLVTYCPNRPGDPAILVADTQYAHEKLNWAPKYSIRDAVLHAWRWEKKNETSK